MSVIINKMSVELATQSKFEISPNLHQDFRNIIGFQDAVSTFLEDQTKPNLIAILELFPLKKLSSLKFNIINHN